MSPSTPDLFVQLEEKAFRHSQTTADFAIVSGVLLDALGVEDPSDVEVHFDDESYQARIRGLQEGERERLAKVGVFEGGKMGTIQLIPNPEVDEPTTGC